MKKIFLLLMATMLSLASCSKDEGDDSSSSNENQEQTNQNNQNSNNQNSNNQNSNNQDPNNQNSNNQDNTSSVSPKEKVLNFLKENFGKKTIMGAMANVSVDQKEAGYCKKELGKTPAIYTIDMIHLQYSWGKGYYANVSKFVDHYNNGGLVAISWHMMVPTNESTAKYNSTAEKDWSYNTKNFSADNAMTEGTWENTFFTKMLDDGYTYLNRYKEAGVPVLFRPLHEAPGKWFWWGYKGAATFKKLWKYVYDYYTNKGLDNLIWVYTTAHVWDSSLSSVTSTSWYPGDDMVDVVAFDQYGGTGAESFNKYYNIMQTKYPGKIIAQGECGNGDNGKIKLDTFTKQWEAGCRWSWIMPWYSYNCTNLSGTDLGLEWWKDAVNNPNVLCLEDMPGWNN